MIWLTWRQFRTQAWLALAALAAFVVALALTGPNLARLYGTSGIATCDTNCDALASDFLNQVINDTSGKLYWLSIGVMFVLPAIIGVFWGAPLVARELEAGTHRLVWNQSVTRIRWLAVKVLGIGLASMATVGLFSLAVTWWAGPIDTAYLNRMLPEIFATRGIAPIGYAAFAFVVGVTAGMLVRRTVPAMAITLALVVVAAIVMPFGVRGHLMTPNYTTLPLNISSLKSLNISKGGHVTVTGRLDQPGAWILSNVTITTTGKPFTESNPGACNRSASPSACTDWLASLHLRQQVAYQPATRFWALQWYEMTIFLGASLILTLFCLWWIRHRLT
jgi:ABC-type transport system involved in multi-copper enzyme maturation permease subunit